MDAGPLMAIAGGVSPDVIYVNFRQSDSYIRQGFLYPLDKFMAREPREEVNEREPKNRTRHSVTARPNLPRGLIPHLIKRFFFPGGLLFPTELFNFISGSIERSSPKTKAIKDHPRQVEGVDHN